MRNAVSALLLATSLAVSACAPPVGVNPYPPVPPLPAEVVTRQPVSGDRMIWQPGHWDWTGGSYVWAPGLWVLAAGHGTHWQTGYWDRLPNMMWIWVPAHWV
jgi:hypothetical protein